MKSRRLIIKKLGLSGIGLGFTTSILNAKSLVSKAKSNTPIVLSTWDFGIQANEEAWKILAKGGRALDPVEQGVRLTDAYPKDRSVAYRGRPDRDGIVTLDACIMD